MTPENGLLHFPSAHSVDATLQLLQTALQAHGLTLFALVNHSGEAEKAGLSLRPTKLLLFGSPKAGTPLMAAAPTLAIDLPLKALVWENSAGQVLVSINDPAYLQQRHGFPDDLVGNIAGAGMLLQKAIA
jgi:uncharacterized protein (DUF302 family)